MTCESNYGASDVAHELKTVLKERDRDLVSVQDAPFYLQRNDKGDTVHEEDATCDLLIHSNFNSDVPI